MNFFNKKTIVAISVTSMVFSLLGPVPTFAATTPSLGLAASYAVLAGTYTNPTPTTTITGDVGFTTGPGAFFVPLGVHPNYGSGVPYPVAHTTDAANTLTNLNAQTCDWTFPAGAIDLATDTTHGPIGVYAPGVYCTQTAAGAMSIGAAGITLSTPGTYIFRTSGPTNAFTTVDNSNVVLGPGVSACDVFWTPTGSTTLGATTTFKGTIIDNANFITVGANTVWEGRAISLGAGTVTTGGTVSLTAPVCAAPNATLNIIKQVLNTHGSVATASSFNLHVRLAGAEVVGSPAIGIVTPGRSYSLAAGTYTVSEDTNPFYTRTFSGDCDANGSITLTSGTIRTCTITNSDIGASQNTGTINVVKKVINDNGRTKVISDFPLFVNGLPVTSGATNSFLAPAAAPAGDYTVTERVDPNYTQVFSGDCDINGHLRLNPGENKFCIVTNNDIGVPVVAPPVPPLIDVIKVPSPLALPVGPGPVSYTYTVRNIGTVPMTDVTMVGDSCSPITRISGDTNNDFKLGVNETWVYLCSKTLMETHTNTVVATGWANGLSAIDIASATVVVGIPVVPPLIHVTKVASPLTFLAGGGRVTYTERVSNPGTVPLNNVRLTDDTCDPMQRISGDTNSDSKLDPNETWTYTCQTNITKTMSNTAVASGDANGFTVRDFAIATVVVATAVSQAAFKAEVVPVPVPQLPNTGIAPNEQGVQKTSAVLALVLLLVLTSLFVVHRKRSV